MMTAIIKHTKYYYHRHHTNAECIDFGSYFSKYQTISINEFFKFFFLFKIITKDTMLVVANRNGMRIFNLFVDDKTE